jgi:hypothetical protein
MSTIGARLAISLFLAVGVAGCGDGFSDPSREFGSPVQETRTHPTTVEAPLTHGGVDTPIRDVHGTPIPVDCVTCHGPDPATAWTATPGEPFHTGITLAHGTNTCNHCHDPDDRTQLRLADGARIPMADSIALCAQCHGPQKRDFDHGAHGGMNGWWDTRRGPRQRNHCVACHAPHTPAYEQMMPVFPPKDRYFEADHGH